MSNTLLLLLLLLSFILYHVSWVNAVPIEVSVDNFDDLEIAIVNSTTQQGQGMIITLISNLTIPSERKDGIRAVVNSSFTLIGVNDTISISGNDLTRIMTIEPNTSVTLERLLISNGLAFNEAELETENIEESFQSSKGERIPVLKNCGGGIMNLGQLNLTQVTFSQNRARCGGAIFNQGLISNIKDCVFENNRADFIQKLDQSVDPWYIGKANFQTDFEGQDKMAGHEPSYPWLGGGAISQTSFYPVSRPSRGSNVTDSGSIGLINNTQFINNYAFARGGAIFIGAGAVNAIDYCNFTSNSVDLSNDPFGSLIPNSLYGGAIAIVRQAPAKGQSKAQIKQIFESRFELNSVKYGSNDQNTFLLTGGAIFAGIGDDRASTPELGANFTTSDVDIDLSANSAINSVIRKIQNCKFISNSVSLLQPGALGFIIESGGALSVFGNIHKIVGCEFSENRAGSTNGRGLGGAISFSTDEYVGFKTFRNFYQGKIAFLEDTKFFNNVAASGGAIDMTNGRILQTSDCDFRGNIAEAAQVENFPTPLVGFPGLGGAIRVNLASTEDLESELGAIFVFTYLNRPEFARFSPRAIKNDKIEFINSTFVNNTALSCAGAVCVGTSTAEITLQGVNVTDCVVSAEGAGGISISGSIFKIENSEFHRNIGFTGGAIEVGSFSRANMDSTTFDSNFAIRGGAIFTKSGSSSRVISSRFVNNTGNSSCVTVTSCEFSEFELSCGADLPLEAVTFGFGCADGVGGSIYNGGVIRIATTNFTNSSIPNVFNCKINQDECTSLQVTLAAQKKIWGTAGLDVFSASPLLIQNSNFEKSSNFTDFLSAVPLQSILRCEDENSCSQGASCTDKEDLTITCACDGVYKNPSNNPFEGSCSRNEFPGDLSAVKLPALDPITQKPQVLLTWTWSGPSAVEMGLPDSFMIFQSPIKSDSLSEFVGTIPGNQSSKVVTIDREVPASFSIRGVISSSETLRSDFSGLLIFCNPGSIPSAQSDFCLVCPQGTYQNENSCTQCPAEFPITANVTFGARSVSECLSPLSKLTLAQKSESGQTQLITRSCPKGALCALPGTTTETILIKPGFWRASAFSLNVEPCPRPEFCWGGNGTRWDWGPNGFGDESHRKEVIGQPGNNVTDAEAEREAKESANGSNGRRQIRRRSLQEEQTIPQYCRPGHTGPLCLSCQEGFSNRGSGCEPCDSSSDASDSQRLALQLGLLFLGIFMFVVLFLWYQRRMQRKLREKATAQNTNEAGENSQENSKSYLAASIKFSSHLADLMIKSKIILGFLQVLSSYGVTFSTAYPPEVEIVLDRLSIFNLEFARFLSFGCSASSNHYTALVIYMGVPMVLLLIIGLVYAFFSKLNRHKPDALNDLKRGTITGILFLSFLIYPGVSATIFKTFTCQDFENAQGVIDGSVSYLRADLTIDCNDPSRSGWITLAVIGVIIYPVGIVLLYFGLLYKKREHLNPRTEKGGWRDGEEDEVILAIRDSNPEISHLKFLFNAYEPTVWFFEPLELIRKLVQTSLILFFIEGSVTQIAFSMIICYGSIAVLVNFNPFIEDEDDTIAAASLWSLVFASLAALLYKIDAAEADQYNEVVITVTMFFACLTPPMAGLYYILKGFNPHWRSPMEIMFSRCRKAKSSENVQKAREKRLEMLARMHEAKTKNKSGVLSRIINITKSSSSKEKQNIQVQDEAEVKEEESTLVVSPPPSAKVTSSATN